MQTIHKYPFTINNEVVIEMSKGARVLSIQIQNDIPTMWVLVDTEREMEQRVFRIFGTGDEGTFSFDVNRNDYLATIQQGIFVWHIFQT